MRFEFLSNRPDAIPTIGCWYHEEWGRHVRGEMEEESIKRLNEYLNTDKIPFILVATDCAEVLASAQLKFREMGEIFPEKEH